MAESVDGGVCWMTIDTTFCFDYQISYDIKSVIACCRHQWSFLVVRKIDKITDDCDKIFSTVVWSPNLQIQTKESNLHVFPRGSLAAHSPPHPDLLCGPSRCKGPFTLETR